MTAWSLILQGRENEVGTPHGSDDIDPLATLGTSPTEPHKLASQQLSLWGLAGWGLRQASNFLVRKKECRVICVPLAFINSLREKAMAELMAQSPTGTIHTDANGHQHSFVSESDVLLAWWTRLAIAHLNPKSSQAVVIANAYDFRSTIKPELIPQNTPYIGNCVSFITVISLRRQSSEQACLLPCLLTSSSCRRPRDAGAGRSVDGAAPGQRQVEDAGVVW
jgi:hypothetical protein